MTVPQLMLDTLQTQEKQAEIAKHSYGFFAKAAFTFSASLMFKPLCRTH